MSFSKIASIVLYVVVGITIPIMILFYFGENLINQEQYQAKIQKIENPVSSSSGSNFAKDLMSADSLATPGDSSAVVAEQNISEVVPVAAEEVSFNFMEKLVYNSTDLALTWTYILIILTVISTILFPVIYTIANPANMVRSLLILVGVAVIVGISYFLSSAEPIRIIGYTGTDNSNPVTLKFIDTGLIFMYFVLGLALISILYAEIAKYFK